ncbi:XRE family transcriptional regulator [Clostridium tetani]|uniref:transcriptional regulator n=1 Tax=Clostridium phage phiCT453B TaxID=1567013 RepID=UPI0002E9031A|nr:helix-turn-helix transcriptional regulator [Clostridium tetani]YP_009217898.1 transcriptional regulator [Clostridium phage phiCT453B]AJA42554.1 XRE family transcriptional regulator [Clostridium phage phiCT453B]KGI41031.1 transcriptional regulator [Clostridium tetani]KGI45282.1 transcriptional regulator [Clostridium tetani]KGI45778.1 transcriptional regulator [Clostridium tetani]KHO31208.1 transcriptional regulator [Clostridium tetani]
MLGKKIKSLRKDNKITQEELAIKIGVSTSMVGMYETDARKPSYEVLIKIADYFKVSLDYLLRETEYKTYIGTKENCIKFKTVEEAMQFILKQPVVINFCEFNVDKMTNRDLIEFANELLNQLKLISYKYKNNI